VRPEVPLAGRGPAPEYLLRRYSQPYMLTSGATGPDEEVSRLAESKVKRMNINVEVSLHDAFKAATAAKGENMTDVLMRFIEDYVTKNEVMPKKKGRR